MNQFKKAKQQFGNQTESVTDLKTAGITPQKKDLPQNNIETSEKKDKTLSDFVTTESKPKMQAVNPTENITMPQTNLPTIPKSATEVIIQETEIIKNPVPSPTAESVPQSTIYNEESLSEITTMQPQPMLSPQYVTPVVQAQFSDSTVVYAQSVETKNTKSNKKNAPNMFTQKTESKSIRKSLVLKPTSVKKAESYCAKNGGSFNELIQILLDNFIEEYDL